MPRARDKRLVVRRMDDETLVYDLDSHRAHCLNRTADAIWRLCDGRRTVADIARSSKRESAAALDVDVVRLALRELEEAGLLAAPTAGLEARGAPSRRALLMRLGKGAAALLPIVASVVAPTPAQAATPACAAGGPIDSSQCKTDPPDPAFTGCCCSDKGKLCVIDAGGKQDCKGPDC